VQAVRQFLDRALESMMKRTLATVALSAALTGPAFAADVISRPYVKAAAPVAVHDWTGFYAFGGAGAGLWTADSKVISTGAPLAVPAGVAASTNQRFGGSGWFGTVGLGYDWQFGRRWVAGVFGDGQFGDIRGTLGNPLLAVEGQEKLRSSYAAGARVGYLIAPNVLSYVNGGYSGSEWSGTTQSLVIPNGQPFATTSSFWRNGFFVGGGVESNLDIFGITAPGWFMKTEYRSAFYNSVTRPEMILNAPAFPATALSFKPQTQTISTSLVYRFD
jgi:outer membrane immunogenic protein